MILQCLLLIYLIRKFFGMGQANSVYNFYDICYHLIKVEVDCVTFHLKKEHFIESGFYSKCHSLVYSTAIYCYFNRVLKQN
jgi:hypothetical protein